MKKRLLASVVSAALLAACGGGGGSSGGAITPTTPGGTTGTTPAQFNAANVHVQALTAPGQATTTVLSVDGNGALYFGGSSNLADTQWCVYPLAPGEFCGGGAQGIEKYSVGSFTLTQPHGPYFDRVNGFVECNGAPPSSTNVCSMGGVSAINADQISTPLWASDYQGDQSDLPTSELEWGASGGTATVPPAPYNQGFGPPAGNTIVSIVKASSGQLWLSAGGPGMFLYPASVPAQCQGGAACDVIQLANGPGGNMWGMTHTITNGSVSGTLFFVFSPSGTLLNTYTTSDIAYRIAGNTNGLWFTDWAHNAIGKIDAGGKITETSVATANAGLLGITAASDGSIWFTEYNAEKVARLDSNGTINEFPVSFHAFSVASTPPGCLSTSIWVGSLTYSFAHVTWSGS